MQHYMHYGLGFSGSLLTNEQANKLYEENEYNLDTNEIGIRIVSFTENYESKDWATVVIKDCGEIPNYGKMLTLKDIKKLSKKEESGFDDSTKENILIELKKFNLEHLFDKVEFIIYSENY